MVLAELKRARGLRGEIFADPLGSRPERFTPGLQVTLFPPGDKGEVRSAEVERHWLFQDRLVLKFAGIDSRTDAELIEGWEVRIPAELRPPLPEGEFYLSDLVGCRVETVDGRSLGEVTGWQDPGAQVLLEVGPMLIPFVRNFCVTIDPAAKRIVVDLPEGLEDLNT